MPGLEDLFHKPGPAEERLAAEIKRFSFGIAVSPLAEVTPIEGPDEFVRTVVCLGGICIDHAQDALTPQHNITVTGEQVAEIINGKHFIFDGEGMLLMPGFGPPAPVEITNELANTIETLNSEFETQT
jgi:hypothetical protein